MYMPIPRWHSVSSIIAPSHNSLLFCFPSFLGYLCHSFCATLIYPPHFKNPLFQFILLPFLFLFIFFSFIFFFFFLRLYFTFYMYIFFFFFFLREVVSAASFVGVAPKSVYSDGILLRPFDNRLALLVSLARGEKPFLSFCGETHKLERPNFL